MKEKIKDVIAGIVSIFFIAIVFYIYFIQFFQGASYFEFPNDDKTIIYNQRESNSCLINTAEPTIILRMDDVRAYSRLTKPLIDEIIKRNISVTLGVIPEDIEKDFGMISYLRGIKGNPKIEIAQHGNHHDESDHNITEASLLEGYAKIQKVLGVVPITYIPPNNKISAESKDIVSDYFGIISSGGNIIRGGGKMAEIDYTEATYLYNKNEPVPVKKIIDYCKQDLIKTNLCVITIHPQEYATNIDNPIMLSYDKFKEFKGLLDGLQELNANFSTFNDVVYCIS